jgi:hypothetical protein
LDLHLASVQLRVVGFCICHGIWKPELDPLVQSQNNLIFFVILTSMSTHACFKSRKLNLSYFAMRDCHCQVKACKFQLRTTKSFFD